MSVELNRTCEKCDTPVKQRVFFEDEDGGLTITFWQETCPFCKSPLAKPTLKEVKKALTLLKP